MTFIVPRLSMTSSHKTTSIDLQCYQNDVEQFYNFLLRRRYSLLPKFYPMELLLSTEELLLFPAKVYSMESLLLRKFYYLLLKSTLWSFYYLLLRKFYCLLPHKPQWSRNPYSLQRRSNKKKWFNIFVFHPTPGVSNWM